MDLSILLLNFAYAIFGVVLMYASYRVIDYMSPQLDFREELKNGNIAVAIVIGGLFIAIAIIIAAALG